MLLESYLHFEFSPRFYQVLIYWCPRNPQEHIQRSFPSLTSTSGPWWISGIFCGNEKQRQRQIWLHMNISLSYSTESLADKSGKPSPNVDSTSKEYRLFDVPPSRAVCLSMLIHHPNPHTHMKSSFRFWKKRDSAHPSNFGPRSYLYPSPLSAASLREIVFGFGKGVH